MATLSQTAQATQAIPTRAAQIGHLARAIQATPGAQPTVRHLHLAPGNGKQAKSKELAPVTSNLGLIELAVALTKLAISKPAASSSAPRQLSKIFNDSSSFSETMFFRWGQSHNKRSFALNADGSAQYMVKMGETIISIVECLLRETHRMFPNYEPSYREIRAEIKALRLANLEMKDLDLLQTGQWVRIPAIVVCEALTGQGKLSA